MAYAYNIVRDEASANTEAPETICRCGRCGRINTRSRAERAGRPDRPLCPLCDSALVERDVFARARPMRSGIRVLDYLYELKSPAHKKSRTLSPGFLVFRTRGLAALCAISSALR